MQLTRKNILTLGLILVLLLGLVAAVILVRQQQTHKAKAEFDVSQSFTVTDQNNQPVSCSGVNCTTNATTAHIRFNPGSSQDLLNSLP